MTIFEIQQYGKTSENSARTRTPAYFKKKLDQAIYLLQQNPQNKG